MPVKHSTFVAHFFLFIALFSMAMARLPNLPMLEKTPEDRPLLLHQYTPENVHRMFVRSLDDCDPWCWAHCATKRYPQFCFLQGPCRQNCWRVLRA